MIIPANVPGRIILKVSTADRLKKNRILLLRKSLSAKGVNVSEMSHSPTDVAAGWTFVSVNPKTDEEMNSSFDISEGRGADVKENSVATAKDAVSEKSADGVVILKDDDNHSLSSEIESLSSSDVDILEESVGPDHDMLQESQSSHTSSFSISSPLEALSESKYVCTVNVPSEMDIENSETNDCTPYESEDPVSGALSDVSSESIVQLESSTQSLRSSKIFNISPDSKLEGFPEENSGQKEMFKRPPEEILGPQAYFKIPSEEICEQELSKSSEEIRRLQRNPKGPFEGSSEQQKVPEEPSKVMSRKVRNPEEKRGQQTKPKEPSEEKTRHQKLTVQREEKRYCLGCSGKDLFKKMKMILGELHKEVKIVLVYLILWLLVVFVVFCFMPRGTDKNISPRTASNLKLVQDETLKCLGLQHLTAMENNHYGMLLSNVCVNDSVEWKANFERLFKDKVFKPLIIKVYEEPSVQKKTEIIEEFMSDVNNDVQGIKFDLLLQQLEYLELLPSVNRPVMKEKGNESSAFELFSEKLGEQEQLVDQLHQFVDQLKLANFALKSLNEVNVTDSTEEQRDAVELKPKIYRLEMENTFLFGRLQQMLYQFENGDFLDPEYWMGSFNVEDSIKNHKNTKVEELISKVNALLSTNDEIKHMYSHFLDMKSQIDGEQKGSTSASSEESQDGTKNLELLVQKLLGLHQTLADELADIRKWNEMLAGIGSELHKGNNNAWTTFKHTFRGMFAGAQQDLSHRLNSVKDLFQSFTDFWKITGTNSRKFFENALHDSMNGDFSLSGIFPSFGNDDQSNMEEQNPSGNNQKPGDVEKEGEVPKKGSTIIKKPGKNSPEDQGKFNQDLYTAARDINGPWHSNDDKPVTGDGKKSPEVTTASGQEEEVDWDKFRSDWLFQRAADRENLRQASKTKPINWYLRRQQNNWRSPMTKEQAELLEKIEVSHYPTLSKSHSKDTKDHEAS